MTSSITTRKMLPSGSKAMHKSQWLASLPLRLHWSVEARVHDGSPSLLHQWQGKVQLNAKVYSVCLHKIWPRVNLLLIKRIANMCILERKVPKAICDRLEEKRAFCTKRYIVRPWKRLQSRFEHQRESNCLMQLSRLSTWGEVIACLMQLASRRCSKWLSSRVSWPNYLRKRR